MDGEWTGDDTQRLREWESVMRPRGTGTSGRGREATIQKEEARATWSEGEEPGQRRRSGSKSIKCPAKTFSALYKISASSFVRLYTLYLAPLSQAAFFLAYIFYEPIFSNGHPLLVYFQSGENFPRALQKLTLERVYIGRIRFVILIAQLCVDVLLRRSIYTRLPYVCTFV